MWPWRYRFFGNQNSRDRDFCSWKRLYGREPTDQRQLQILSVPSLLSPQFSWPPPHSRITYVSALASPERIPPEREELPATRRPIKTRLRTPMVTARA